MHEKGPRIEWEPALVESAVVSEVARRRAGGDAAIEERYRRACDGAYAETDEARRRVAFERLHRDLFDALGLGRPLEESIAAHPATGAAIDVVLVATAPSTDDESVDLSSVASPRRLLGVRVAPLRFADGALFRTILDHELTHVDDLVDPSFGFTPAAAAAGPSATRAREQLVRARYGALWAVSVDGRLAGTGRAPLRTRAEHVVRVERLFPSLGHAAAAEIVDGLLSGPRPTHAELLEKARVLGPSNGARGPGLPCPLCGFPTFAWANAAPPEPLAAAIRADFATWSPEDGLCERCLESYEMRTPMPVAMPAGGAIPF